MESAPPASSLSARLPSVRAGNRRFGRLSALRAHTNAPCKTRFTVENAKGAQPRRAGPDRGESQEAVVAAEENIRQHLPLGLGHLAVGHGVILP